MERRDLFRKGSAGLLGLSMGSLLMPSGTAGAAGADAADEESSSEVAGARFITAGDRDPHQVIAAAPPYCVVLFDRNRPWTLDQTLVIDKPLTVLGLHARLPDGLAATPLVAILAEGVRFTDFELHGNTESITTDWGANRASCLTIQAGDFVIERGWVTRASRHGILVGSGTDQDLGDYVAAGGKQIRNGVIRDIIAHDIRRDAVSIEGRPEGSISHLLVENIWLYRSPDRGAVEACDGADNIILRNIYAEDAVYVADVMHDHGKNVAHNHTLENIHGVRCRHVVRTANRDLGHTGLTVRNVVAEQCQLPLRISNTRGVWIEGVQVKMHPGGPIAAISNCHGVRMNQLMLLSGTRDDEAIQWRGCTHTRADELLDVRPDEA
jgi:hypothetical protein